MVRSDVPCKAFGHTQGVLLLSSPAGEDLNMVTTGVKSSVMLNALVAGLDGSRFHAFAIS